MRRGISLAKKFVNDMPLSCFYIIYFHTRTRTIIVHIRRYSIGEGGGNMLEYEKKMLLTEEEYFKFLHLIGKEKPRFIQTNYYYDTVNNDLKTNNYSLRIRHIENLNKYIITLKIQYHNPLIHLFLF